MNERPALIVGGPTGSGKSALALDVAEALDGVVVNADSAQVYRELRVLTARPSMDDEARAPHRLYGVLPAAERCSAGRWLAMAHTEIAATANAGRLPIVVGGTGLYLKALTRGLAPVPAIPPAVRAAAEALHAQLGGAGFREMLSRCDPEGAARLPDSDRQRLLRAWEVVRATGRPLADWQRREPAPPPSRTFLTIVLLPSRDSLYPALDARFQHMLAAGAIAEVEDLLALGLNAHLPAMKAVGVRELARYLRGECRLSEAAAAAQQATRRFAKRQTTWLRHQVQADSVLFAQYSESLLVEILSIIRRVLLTGDA